MNRNDMAAFNCRFNNCLVRTRTEWLYMFNNTILNEDPLFKSVDEGDYQLDIHSPAVNKGSYTYIVLPYDLAGNMRSNPPTIGAYELTITSE